MEKGGLSRRRFGLMAAAGVAVTAGALLASCASLTGPRRVELSEAKLQAGLERRFPLRNRLLELFDVQLTRPQVAILPQSDRVALTMDMSVSPPFLRQSWAGTMTLSGHLYVDAARSGVFLADAHVDRFDIEGMDGARARDLGRAADVLMNQLVRDVAIYSFRMDDLRYAGTQFVPTRLETVPGALVVTVEPVR
ncbi:MULTISPECIES: DUF1439 domain-containing protein [unclassified Massilia]|uniref:DUF1439 domain-containing protein n=1 Tax=unclassified Massilia TaxID=2609279 RepID=UPI000B2C7D85|nr:MULTISPECIES: DUF1439 domain-containing protein [unclassified Massilia]